MKIIWNDISEAPKTEFMLNENELFTLLVIASDGLYLNYWQQNISKSSSGQSIDFYTPPKCTDKTSDHCTLLVYSQNGEILPSILFVTKPNADLARSRFNPKDIVMSLNYEFGEICTSQI